MQHREIFPKHPLSIDEQIALLEKRGLVIHNLESTRHCLQTVSYYRLSGYFKPFEDRGNNQYTFIKGTTFEKIWDIYTFDRELRLLLLDALERIEIALRSTMSNHMSLKYGSLWYLLAECFHKKWTEFSKKPGGSPSDYFRAEVNHICKNEKEEFIKHYFSKYHHPTYPPSWMIMECLSFGTCLNLFRYLAKVTDKSTISKSFGYHPKVVESCLVALRYTRNICAHHARLWNRWFVVIPKHIKVFENIETKQRSLHQQLIIIQHLHRVICPDSRWKDRLFQLFKKHESNLIFNLMGFQKDWQNDPFWKL